VSLGPRSNPPKPMNRLVSPVGKTVTAQRTKVALPLELSAKPSNLFLPLKRNHELETSFHRFAFGLGPRCPHCLLHQLFVNDNVRSHGVYTIPKCTHRKKGAQAALLAR